MFSDRVFQITFLVSLIAHGVILFQNPNLGLFPTSKNEQKLEISYIKTPPEVKTHLKAQTLPKKEPFLKLPSEITGKKKTPPPFIDKEAMFKNIKADSQQKMAFTKPTFIKPEITKPDVIAIKKKITLPPIDMNKINNPSYISYYQTVREKVKRAAYYNYNRAESGEVYVSFIVTSGGFLKDVRLIEERSSPNPYLRDIALRSIKDASPFPNFPKDLDYPNLSFNVIISFEIE